MEYLSLSLFKVVLPAYRKVPYLLMSSPERMPSIAHPKAVKSLPCYAKCTVFISYRSSAPVLFPFSGVPLPTFIHDGNSPSKPRDFGAPPTPRYLAPTMLAVDARFLEHTRMNVLPTQTLAQTCSFAPTMLTVLMIPESIST